jgi:hypothetical protein
MSLVRLGAAAPSIAKTILSLATFGAFPTVAFCAPSDKKEPDDDTDILNILAKKGKEAMVNAAVSVVVRCSISDAC